MTQTPQTQYEQEINSVLSVPRRFGGLGNLAADRLAAQFQQLRRKIQSTNTASGKAVPINPTLPKQVLSVSATQTADKQQDRTFSLVTVSFTRNGSDPNFAGVRIWFKGYKGNAQWQLMADGTDSPVSFLEEATGETVQVAVQAFNQSGFAASFASAPTTTVTLSGVVSAPPAPTVSQMVTPVVGGFQFTFTLEAGLLADVIDSYKVYRNTINSSGSASVVQTIKHPQSNNGSYVVQDYPGGDSVYFYWVSAVNTVGLESSLTAAQASTNMALSTQKAFGKNMLPNPGFEFNAVGVTALVDMSTVPSPICDGWYLEQSDSGYWAAAYENNGSGRNASNNLRIRLLTGISIPNGVTSAAGRVIDTVRIPIATGDYLRVSGWASWSDTAALPAGVTGTMRIGFLVFAADGTILGEITGGDIHAPTAFTFVQGTLQIPATMSSKVPAYVAVECVGFITNTSGSTFSTGANLYMDLRFDDMKAIIQNTAFDLTPINTSGQPQTTVSPLSQSGTTKTILVAATTWQFGDGTVSYNSGSVTTGAYGTFYVYASDPTYSGGSVTYVATSNAWGIIADNGFVYFGVITTTAGGGATGAGGGTGGGGGGGKRSLT